MCKVKEAKEKQKKLVVQFTDGKEVVTEAFEDPDPYWIDENGLSEAERRKLTNVLTWRGRSEEEVKDVWSIKLEEEDTVYLSKHAVERMKERNGWSKKASMRMTKRIFDTGKRSDDLDGNLKKWVKSKEGRIDNSYYIVYGKNAYIFGGNTMITMIHLPGKAAMQEQLRNLSLA